MGQNSSRQILDYDDAAALLGSEEVARIEEGFNRLAVRGELRPSEFRSGFLNSVGEVPEALAEALFNCFDSNSSGTLNVQQFVSGVAVLYKGRPEQKLRLLFMVYDADRDQRLSDRDLQRFSVALSDGRCRETAEAAVNSALQELLAGNSAVDYKKFELWARQHVDSPLVDWIFGLEQRVNPLEEEEATGVWRMIPQLDRSDSLQEREEMSELVGWGEQEGVSKALTLELRGFWQSVAAGSRLGVVDKAAFLRAFPSLKVVAGRLLGAMDRSKTGTVSAREWVQDLATCLQGSQRQREELLSRMFAGERPESEAVQAALLALHARASSSALQLTQVLGDMVRIDLKMPPSNAREERRIIERLNEKFSPEEPGNVGDVWYLISARWWEQWLDFTSMETSTREQGPPSIDNTALVDARDHLRIGLSEGVDYEVVLEEAWRALVAWHGLHSMALPRKVIEVEGRTELEMYPLRLHVSKTDRAGRIILMERFLEISRAALASEAKQEACDLHSLAEESDVVLCHRINEDFEFVEVDESKTLHALHFLDGDQLLLRFKGAPLGRSTSRLVSTKNHGHVGLQNLGNTCYMNAAIQCLVHAPFLPEYFKSEYLLDLNPNTKFGMGGKLAVAFAELVEEIRQARHAGYWVVAPRDFKRIFSDFKPQFAGWKQQDAQEFLSMFLAGLSEDVNRTSQKPYSELRDSEHRPDAEVALEYWQSHCLRERSAVAALYSGQFRSVLRCKCGYTNHSFEAFSFLPIPIPEHQFRWVTCMVRAASSESAQHTTRVCARVPKQGSVKQLLEAAGGMLGLEVEHLVAAEVGHGYVSRLWQSEKPLSVLHDDVRPWIFHAPNLPVTPLALKVPSPSPRATSRRSPSKGRFRAPENLQERVAWRTSCWRAESGSVVIQLVHRRLRPVQRYFYNPYKSELFGYPVVLRLPNRCPGWRLYSAAWLAVRHLVPDLAEPVEDWPFSLSTVKRDGTACAHCSWRQGCLGCTIPAEEEVYLTAEETVGVDWDASVLQQQYKERFATHVHDHESVGLAQVERKSSISLEQCLESLVAEEELNGFCKECTKQAKEFTESPQVKSLCFWACPPLLVLQLKRFHTSEGASYKLFNEVVFGQTLDLKDFLCDGGKACHKTETFVDWHRPLRERSSDEMRWAGFPGLSREVTKYQLYGVVNHIGGMGSGHYTACILHDKQWYCFNDDRVYTISDQDVCSANAYLLFYARSDVAEGQKDFSQLFPPEGRQVKAANLEQIKQSTWVSDLHRASSKGTAAGGDRFCAVS